MVAKRARPVHWPYLHSVFPCQPKVSWGSFALLLIVSGVTLGRQAAAILLPLQLCTMSLSFGGTATASHKVQPSGGIKKSAAVLCTQGQADTEMISQCHVRTHNTNSVQAQKVSPRSSACSPLPPWHSAARHLCNPSCHSC